MAPLVSNLRQRRKHIKQLLDEFGKIPPKEKRELAKLYEVSCGIINFDISLIQDTPLHHKTRVLHQVSSENARAARLGVEGRIDIQEWHDLMDKYDHLCLKCGNKYPLHIDHVVPISKGGKNTIDNIQPLCASCNLTKSTDDTDYRPR